LPSSRFSLPSPRFSRHPVAVSHPAAGHGLNGPRPWPCSSEDVSRRGRTVTQARKSNLSLSSDSGHVRPLQTAVHGNRCRGCGMEQLAAEAAYFRRSHRAQGCSGHRRRATMARRPVVEFRGCFSCSRRGRKKGTGRQKSFPRMETRRALARRCPTFGPLFSLLCGVCAGTHLRLRCGQLWRGSWAHSLASCHSRDRRDSEDAIVNP
jgi:hypothetical protein